MGSGMTKFSKNTPIALKEPYKTFITNVSNTCGKIFVEVPKNQNQSEDLHVTLWSTH